MSIELNSIQILLSQSKTIAVVGLSAKPDRPSHAVAKYLQEHRYRIVPVNPTYAGTKILNETCHANLSEAAAALRSENQTIDLVDCFRKSETVLPIVAEAIAIGARGLWMQIGVVNQQAAEKASAAGLQVVMDRCLKIEHQNSNVVLGRGNP
ncbi:CoA-binding protein [soil metagenome]